MKKGETVNVLDFGSHSGGEDFTPALLEALETCRRKKARVLDFPKGEYHFHPAKALEIYVAVSNNSHGLKRFAVPITGMNELEIRGNGSRFLMHGVIVPFIIQNSHGIIIKDLSVDWAVPFYAQGEVLASSKKHFDVSIEPGYKTAIEDGHLHFLGENWNFPLINFLEFDPLTRGVAKNAIDNCGSPWTIRRKTRKLSENKFRIFAEMSSPPKEGNVMVLRAPGRHTPGIFTDESSAVTFEKVKVHHCGGMAFIAQNSRDITLSGCEVSASRGRIFSTAADATHFVGCSGKIRISDSLFESQLDDALNVHGIYGRLESRIGGNEVLVRLAHHMQLGVDIGGKGDTMRFTRNRSLVPFATEEIRSVRKVNPEYMIFSFNSLPDFKPGDVVENLDRTPDLYVSNCIARRNHARSFLISTPGKVVVSGNTLTSLMSAIKISGDAEKWYESGPVQDVQIRNNLFAGCNYGSGMPGHAVIEIDPEVREFTGQCYHRNVIIEENNFCETDGKYVYARSVENLRCRHNKIASEYVEPAKMRCEFSHCKHVLNC